MSGGGKRHAVMPALNSLLASRHLWEFGKRPVCQHVIRVDGLGTPF